MLHEKYLVYLHAKLFLSFGRIHLAHVYGKQSKNTSLTSINFIFYNEGENVDIFNGDFSGDKTWQPFMNHLFKVET